MHLMYMPSILACTDDSSSDYMHAHKSSRSVQSSLQGLHIHAFQGMYTLSGFQYIKYMHTHLAQCCMVALYGCRLVKFQHKGGSMVGDCQVHSHSIVECRHVCQVSMPLRALFSRQHCMTAAPCWPQSSSVSANGLRADDIFKEFAAQYWTWDLRYSNLCSMILQAGTWPYSCPANQARQGIPIAV